MLNLPARSLLRGVNRQQTTVKRITLLILSLLFTVYYLLFTAPVAQAANVDQPSILHNRLEEFKQAVGSDELNRDRLIFEDFANLNVTLIYALGGCEQADCPLELAGGFIPIVGGMIAGMYDTRPVSGFAYTANIVDKFRPTPAYAQGPGSGFRNLLPLLPIWRAFRDFTYILFALAFVAMGFAIMFRVKLNPQVTITIQSALPRLIIGLLLITFSYAIAGFVVDLIYVFIAIGILIFSQVPGPPDLPELQDAFLTGGFPTAIREAFGTAFGSGEVIPALGFGALGAIIASVITKGAAVTVGSLTLGPAPVVGFGIGVLIFILIILLILAYLLVRLFLELLRSYLAIILAVIFAPFQIILGVVPGLPGFTGWLKGLLANAMVFPAVALALLLTRILFAQPHIEELWAAPLLGGSGSLIRIMLGFGILLIVYQIPPAIRKAMGAEGLGFQPLEAVRFGVGPAVGIAGGRIRTLAPRQYARFALRAHERAAGGRYLGLTQDQWQEQLRGFHLKGLITDQEAEGAGVRRLVYTQPQPQATPGA